MSLSMTGSDRDKFFYLLQLSSEQIRALEADDMFAFDRILAAKDAVIASFHDARAMAASDASLGTVIQQIQDADQAAQRLLYRKTGRIMRELTEIRRQHKARQAYQAPQSAPSGASPTDTPRFVDRGR